MPPKQSVDRRRFPGAGAGVLATVPFELEIPARQRAQAAVQLPSGRVLSALDHASEWLNSPPLKAAELRGKVVLISLWTYSSIYWIRAAPYVRAWAEQYRERGLVVIGVHAPEFPFEHSPDNVRQAARDAQLDYPIATDNDFAIWRTFRNQYWPAFYVLNAQGRICHQQFGEGEYDRLEGMIQKLLAEAGGGGTGPERASVDARGVEAEADWDSLQSPENYLGYARTENFASPGWLRLNVRHAYKAPGRLAPNQWALSGDWTVKPNVIALHEANGSITYRFHARDLHLVMGPATPGAPVRFRVRLDGSAPGAAHGLDVDEQGNGTVTGPRLYQLVRQPNPVADRQFEIRFLDAGVEAFAFTFG